MYPIDKFIGNIVTVTDRLEKDGYIMKEQYADEAHVYRAYLKNGEGVFINFFKSTGEVQTVTQKECNYFEFCGGKCNHVTTPQITQLHLEDFGMSYVIRLTDGRFIVIDGGREFEPDADRLYNKLKEDSEDEMPVIALWIMTHPHNDHYHNFFTFYEKYGKSVVTERFMFNFPDADDTAHYPELDDDSYDCIGAEIEMIPKFYGIINEIGAPVYTAHTGQRYEIGGAVLEILASLDDTYGVTQNMNSTSLVIRMTLAGQVILWGADASVEYAQLAKRYGKSLKADILQVMHHGFGGGSPEEEARGYSFIDPDICLLAVSDYNAYVNFCAFKGGARHLMSVVDIKEMITGDRTATLTLPYTPDKNAVKIHREKYQNGQKSAGAHTWVFTGLDSGNADDFTFTFLNMTSAPAKIIAELYFEDRAHNVTFIRFTANACRLTTVDITDKSVISSEDDFYNLCSLDKKGIAKNLPFAVRFLSDIPIVVSHNKHKETYRS